MLQSSYKAIDNTQWNAEEHLVLQPHVMWPVESFVPSSEVVLADRSNRSVATFKRG